VFQWRGRRDEADDMGTPESSGGEQSPTPRSAFSFGGEQAGYLGPGGVSSRSSATSGSSAPARRDPATPRRGRRQARLLVGLAVLAAAAVAAVVAGLAGGGSSGSPATASVSLSRAAYVTSRSPGFKFRFTVAASLAGHSFSIESHGSIDEATLEGTEELEIEGHQVQEVIKNPYVYVQVPSGSSSLNAGKPWIRANLSDYTQTIGAGSSFEQGGAGPTQMLHMLDASGDVVARGSETIEGAPTTHYHALVDLSRYATEAPAAQRSAIQADAQALARLTGSSSLPVDVWIDDQGRVRRFSTEEQVCTPAGKLHEQITMGLYGFGPQQPVTVPAPSEVNEVTSTLDSKTAQALSQVGCR
jgi:hypothetical protein